MSKAVALKRNSEFRRAYAKGGVKLSSQLATYAVKNRGLGVRVGVTASKKLGTAVERNRCRRVIKAAFSRVLPLCRGNWDLVFVSRFKTKKLKSRELVPVMLRHLTVLGVIPGGAGEGSK